MAKLVEPDFVIQAYNYDTSVDIRALVREALELATIELSGILDLELPSANHVDRFWYDPDQYPVAAKYVQLLLKTGLVQVAGLTVKIAATVADLASATPVDAALVSVKAEKGIVTLFDDAVENKGFIEVSYTAGFQAVDIKYANDGQVYQGTPAWLQQLALELTAKRVREHYSASNKEYRASKDLDSRLGLHLETRIRRSNLALKPL